MRALIVGISGAIGRELAPALISGGCEVSGFSRSEVELCGVDLYRGDLLSGENLEAAFDGVDVVYYLAHSLERSDGTIGGQGLMARERRAVDNVILAANRSGVRRAVYLGGIQPSGQARDHLASRLMVEQRLLSTLPETLALRSSIVIGARSRSFRLLVHLVERMRLLPLPSWRDGLTQPIDERDVVAALVAAIGRDDLAGRSLDLVGPEAVSYGELIARIADRMVVGRHFVPLPVALRRLSSPVVAAIVGEQLELVGPLMDGLDGDLLPSQEDAADLLRVPLHTLDRAIEHALADWESREPLVAY